MTEGDAPVPHGEMEEDEGNDHIAVIGMAGRFPMAANIDEFWENLKEGRECVSFFSPEELLTAGVDPSVMEMPGFVNARAVMDDPAGFDAGFFGMSPKEAELTDPQHRVFLECAWHALENAGYDANRYDGLVGVYGGSDINSYALTRNILAGADWLPALFGSDKDYLTTRTAFKMNLKGPAVTVQTACSTSLVAVQTACQGLLDFQSDIALAGGVGIAFPQKAGYWYQEGGMLSPDGHCRSFDENSKGTVGGDGVGIVVLKRLSEAVTDGDNILAVIRAAAVNNDGAMKIGFTAPSIEGQSEVIATALATAEVDPETITYVEAHGTATELGDPVEVTALTDAFGAHTDKKQFCALGSLKSNVGHMNSAAGVGGLIKTILSLKNGMIPPSLHYEKPNPNIDFASSPFYVNAAAAPWNPVGFPRRAGVSSFGVGGTNAHVILEEAGAPEPGSPSRPLQVLVVSAATPSALDRATRNLADHLKAEPGLDLADGAYTLQTGRRLLKHRRSLVCRNREEAVKALENAAQGQGDTRSAGLGASSTTFLFPGQGAQYVNMGKDLYENEGVFREVLDQCAELLIPHLVLDLREILHPSGEKLEWAEGLLAQTRYTQPALFAVEYALSKLWISWGVTPGAMIGHSIGEYVAATLAGVFSLEDALMLVAARGRLMESTEPGAMLSVSLTEVEASSLPGVSVAAANAPGMCVISGPTGAVEAIRTRLEGENTACSLLKTSHAFHSALMDPVVGDFKSIISGVKLSPPELPYISNVTGDWITEAEALSPDYWAGHIRKAVRFSDGVKNLLADPDRILLEVGPGRTLVNLARRQMEKSDGRLTAVSLPHPRENRDDLVVVLGSLGELYCADVDVDWAGFYAEETRRRVPLPVYPFEHEEYLYESDTLPMQGANAAKALMGKNPNINEWLYQPSWKRVALSPAGGGGKGPATSDSVLVLAKDRPLDRLITTRLGETGANVTVVMPGKSFAPLGENLYGIAPGIHGDYLSLFEALGQTNRLPDRVIHLWNLDDGTVHGETENSPATHGVTKSGPATDSPAPETSQDEAKSPGTARINVRTSPDSAIPPRDGAGAKPVSPDASREETGAQALPEASGDPLTVGFRSLLFLYQALAARASEKKISIGVAVSGMYEVVGDEPLCPERALLTGLVRVIPQESPDMDCRIMDFTAPGTPASKEALVANLVNEMGDGETGGITAYRGKFRWVETFEPMKAGASSGAVSLLRDRGVYLITGGLGKIGLTMAKKLAESVKARLVLLGKTGLPPAEDWDAWLASHDVRDRISGRIRKVREIEALGSEVITRSCDVSDKAGMTRLIGDIQARFGGLNGVIHGAGIMGQDLFRTLRDIHPEQSDLHFGPKIRGLRTLADLLPESLDFFMTVSSLSTVLGGVGLGAYAAANHYMDALVCRENRNGKFPWISVDWDGWTADDASGREGGMAMNLFAIAPEEGAEVFQRLLTRNPGERVIVSTMDLDLRISHEADRRNRSDGGTGGGASGGKSGRRHARPDLDTPYVAPEGDTEVFLAETFQQLLEIDKIGVNDNFFQLGGDSLAAISLATRIRDHFNIEIDVNSLFDEPTISALARKIEDLIQAGANQADEIAGKLDMIENMSEEEVLKMLAELEDA